MIYEYELKYKTHLTQESFEKGIYNICVGHNTFDFIIKYKDKYFYKSSDPAFFMRYRDDYRRKALTFKEETDQAEKRKEINIFKEFSSDELETLASIQGFDKRFEIEKEALVIQVPTKGVEFSWYEVNGANRFIEIELTGNFKKPKEELEKYDDLLNKSFAKKISRINRSLFSLYKSKRTKSKLIDINFSTNFPVCRL